MNSSLLLRPSSVFVFFFLLHFTSFAATFTSANSGNWFDDSTWLEAGAPCPTDDVTINNGHVVTLTGSAYTHYANIIIMENAEMIVDAGDHIDGLIYCGYEFHVFGSLTFTAAKDFAIIGVSHFWAHPNANIHITDDWKLSQHSNTTLESVCVKVDDDFQISGADAYLCGEGGVSIGAHPINNTFDFLSGASITQVCIETTVYRSGGASCGSFYKSGYGNSGPNAIDDVEVTTMDTPLLVDVLDLGTADNDPDGDDLTILAAGTDYMNNGISKEGGLVLVIDNETPGNPNDDFISYTPPAGFTGTDEFFYIITDGNGGFDYATVTIDVNAALPVELVDFSGKDARCEVSLSWATATELNNSHFEIERSVDGYRFRKIGTVKGSGTSNQYHVYDFKDVLPVRENYYRLKQVDFNGVSTYSAIIFISNHCAASQDNISAVTIYPNPAINGNVNMRFEASIEENALLSVSDLYGKNILRQEVNIENGVNNFPVDISDLQAGTYIITLGNKTTKFVKAVD